MVSYYSRKPLSLPENKKLKLKRRKKLLSALPALLTQLPQRLQYTQTTREVLYGIAHIWWLVRRTLNSPR